MVLTALGQATKPVHVLGSNKVLANLILRELVVRDGAEPIVVQGRLQNLPTYRLTERGRELVAAATT